MDKEYSDSEIWALGEQLGNPNTSWEEVNRLTDLLAQQGVRSIDALFHALRLSAKNHSHLILVEEALESALTSMGEAAIEPLTKRIEENPYLHILPTVLVKVGGEKVLGTIIKAFRRVYSTPNSRILIFPYDMYRPARLLYVYLLGKFNTPEVRALLKEVATQDRSTRVRTEAYEALQKIKRSP